MLLWSFEFFDASSISFKPLADGIGHFKETVKDVEICIEAFEKLAEKVTDEKLNK